MAYQLPSYVADMVTLVARLDVESVAWVGTSLGGLIGMVLASLPDSPIGRLVLNDVGPALDAAGIARIASYVGAPLTWASEDEAADYLLTISQGFGPHSRDEWVALTRPMLRRDGDRFRLHYDPAIAVPLRAVTPEAAAAGQAGLWAAYDAIRCPTLLLRGASSDILSRDTAAAMMRRGPKARLHELEGVGHAPTLVARGQVDVVREFLLTP
jgi:pimeloyl-ACP methyl ester carboxylesterase